jgi:FKBP-type peptidyl-prolyl cis-trans isomerase SlyD
LVIAKQPLTCPLKQFIKIMKISKNKVVSVSYTLHSSRDGAEATFVEQTPEGQPFTFLFGYQGVIEAFEENLNGLEVGDKFEFSISPEDGYGLYTDDAVITLPMEAFGIEGEVDKSILHVGAVLPMADNAGRQFQGVVKEVGADYVTMDFNHPMSGHTLFFSGEVINLREATDEEISHGHVHGPGGHYH